MRFNWYSSYEGYIADNFENIALSSLDPKDPKNPQTKPNLFICHEFFDAMPAMIFEYSEMGWVEKLVGKTPKELID